MSQILVMLVLDACIRAIYFVLLNGAVSINSCGRSKHSDCSLFLPRLSRYLEDEKSMIHSFTVTFGAKYLTGMGH